MKRIGIFGGTFDPIHTGHILIAEAAERQFKLDEVVFIPARRSPHKPRAVFASAAHRIAMIRAAIRGRRTFTWSDVEMHRAGLSFTVDTLKSVQEMHPGAQLFLLLGSDNIRSFRTWKEPKKISDMAQLIVYQRWDFEVTQRMLARWHAKLLKGPEIFISSTAIRHRCSSGRSIRHFVPPAVERYIIRHSLYQTSSRKA